VEIAISKGKLYEALRETGLVPRYRIASRDELLARSGLELDGGPVWLRDYSDASSSGIGSIQVAEPEEAYAWAYLNPEIPSYMVAEHLPGRNIACTLLFHEDELLKAACYERLEYFMGHLAVSGVTGNINRGRLINDERARTLAEQAVRFVGGLAGEAAHGLLTVDLREDRTGALKVTEINVRHVAATSALAAGGANMAEAQVLATLGRLDEIGETVPHFPDDNVILRDIDGAPLWLTEYRELAVGEHA
jgi:carbamoyl-phosphate synthase large subunit